MWRKSMITFCILNCYTIWKKKDFELNNSMNKEFSERTSIFNSFWKKISTINKINAEISQEFSVSFILYLFFNANLLDVCEQSKRKTTVIEFVDDVNVLTYSTSTEKNCKIFEKLHEIFTTWFRRHEAIFFSTKYELIHLNKNSKKFNM